MSGAGALDQEIGPTITAALDDGPLRGTRIEAQVVQEWTQSGPSAKYTFLYPV
jgi:hypothetical protein